MKKILLILALLSGVVFANTVNELDRQTVGDRWTLGLSITPPEVLDNARVSDGNKTQNVAFNTEMDTTVYFLIDTSIPMKNSFNKGVKPFLVDMERVKPLKEKWVVSYFDDDLHVVYDDVKNHTGDLKKLLNKVPVKGQRTELWRNMQTALKDLSGRTSERKILVVLSDGDAEDTSAYTLNDVVDTAKKSNIRIVSLAYRDTIGTQNLRRIADDTQGAFWKANKKTQKLPNNFYREFLKFVRSQGKVSIPSEFLGATESGEVELLITLLHGEDNSTITVVLPTEKLLKQEENVTEEVVPEVNVTEEDNASEELAVDTSTTVTDENTEPSGFFEKYKLYLALLAALIAMLLLYFLLRKNAEKIEDDEGIDIPEADFSGNKIENLQTQMNQTVVNAEPSTVGFSGVNEKIVGSESAAIAIAYLLASDGSRFDVHKLPSRVGKSQDNDIVIPDKFISRHHAIITHKNGFFYIVDDNSSNGVLVNGQKIAGEAKLTEGDKLSFGPYKMTWHINKQNGGNNDEEKTRWVRS